MAYYDEPMIDPSLEFDAQDLQLQQQLARVKALRAVGSQTPEVNNGEVGGWSLSTGQRMPGRVLKTPAASLINPILGTIGADIGDARSVGMKNSISKNQQDEMVAALAATPQSTEAIPSRELMGPTPNGGPLMSQAVAAQDPTRNDILAHGARLARNPLTRATAQKYIDDQLIGAPSREATQRLELTKAALTSRDKALDRDNRLEAARIRAQASGGAKLTMIQDDAGNVTGGYDPKTNRTFPLGQLPGGTASLDTQGPAVRESDVGGANANTGTPVQAGTTAAPAAGTAAPANGVVGKSSTTQQTIQKDYQTKVAEANDAIGLIQKARGNLKNTSYGWMDSLGEGITRVAGLPTSEKGMNATQLDIIAGQLASKYPRGPGTITDTERELFEKYMGAVGNRFIDPAIREKNLILVEDMLRKGVENAAKANAGGGLLSESAPAAAPAATAPGAAPQDKSVKDFGGGVKGTYSAKYGHYYAKNADGKFVQLD
jgi:hypothetical protein